MFLVFSLIIQLAASNFFYPKVHFETYGRGRKIAHLSAFDPSDPEQNKQLGLHFLLEKLHLDESDLVISNSFTDHRGCYHLYVAHVVNGLEISNHRAQIHLKNGHITSYSSSFDGLEDLKWKKMMSQPRRIITPEIAAQIASDHLNIPYTESIPVKKGILQLEDGRLTMVYIVQLQSTTEFFQVSIETSSGSILEVIDFKSKAVYDVISLSSPNPEEGFFRLSDPYLSQSSPLGWHSNGANSYKSLGGNNVIVAITDMDRKLYEYADDGLTFTGNWDPTVDPRENGNPLVSARNLFYVVNMMHDLTYQYGFTESAGNFQDNNFGNGGVGSDAVHAYVQVPNGMNNAFFISPPDGANGMIAMFIFNMTSPPRDGALDNEIIIHEFTHGVSSRLTGGAASSNCLETKEANSLGEGWSDAMALFVQRKQSDSRKTDVALGSWAYGGRSIRRFPYSTDFQKNPLLCKFLHLILVSHFSAINEDIHELGTIWATILNEMYWTLVDAYGFTEDIFNSNHNAGNVVAIQIMIGGMMLQPCNPSYLQAFEAILQADQNYYGGMHACEIWRAFAKRGMGINAQMVAMNEYIDDFEIPTYCYTK